MKESLIALSRKFLSRSVRRILIRYTLWPPVGWIFFGNLRRLKPISHDWGFERGLPVDRYYIEQFLRMHASDIRGEVLEIKEDLYTTRFGGEQVTKVDILHIEEGNPSATIVADLTRGDKIPSDKFDCIVLTQTLQFIYDIRVAIKTLFRILKPGGVLLTTVSGISKISREDMDCWGHYWGFTTKSAQRLFEEFFPIKNVTVACYGNVLTAAASLYGIAANELRRKELQHHDPDFQILIAIRTVKPPPNE
jgi:SAM-dependent methyltransferase